MYISVTVQRVASPHEGILIGSFGNAPSAESWRGIFNDAAKNEVAAMNRISKEFQLPLAGRIRLISADIIPVEFSGDSAIVAVPALAHPILLLKSIIANCFAK